jgi:hypothetical protein
MCGLLIQGISLPVFPIFMLGWAEGLRTDGVLRATTVIKVMSGRDHMACLSALAVVGALTFPLPCDRALAQAPQNGDVARKAAVLLRAANGREVPQADIRQPYSARLTRSPRRRAGEMIPESSARASWQS